MPGAGPASDYVAQDPLSHEACLGFCCWGSLGLSGFLGILLLGFFGSFRIFRGFVVGVLWVFQGFLLFRPLGFCCWGSLGLSGFFLSFWPAGFCFWVFVGVLWVFRFFFVI